ncbi:ras-related protein Rab-5A-like [Tubulanus polymorphus]|uniref:ras-related protein Rab-5A-like n=1 Tax=Tubulanus polymorphus TaxID=672921 RepID=UPI003DA3E4FA
MPNKTKRSQNPQRPRPRAHSKSGPFRLVLLGEAAVGKTSIVIQLTDKRFKQIDPTIGAAYSSHAVTIEDCTYKYEIWDTAGQERFHCITPMYYRGAQATVIVYDITDRKSFQKAKEWVREVQRLANPDIIIALAGNKSDLKEQRVVSYEEAKQYASGHGFIFLETSAKFGTNVDEIFIEIAKKLPKDFVPRPKSIDPVVPVEEEQEKKKGGVCSCG